MTSTYRITPRALQDLQNIGRYTLKNTSMPWKSVSNGWLTIPMWGHIDRKSEKAISATLKAHTLFFISKEKAE